MMTPGQLQHLRNEINYDVRHGREKATMEKVDRILAHIDALVREESAKALEKFADDTCIPYEGGCEDDGHDGAHDRAVDETMKAARARAVAIREGK